MSEDHENFELDKKIDDDATVGLPNNVDILCANCNVLLIEAGVATKVQKPVSLSMNNHKDNSNITLYVYIDSFDQKQYA